MSIAALNWSMNQRTDGPSAQAVLFVIADRASEHGLCRHADPDTIAEKTRQSRATVFRRLEELERAGVLTRFTRHLDDGRREYEIRLQFKAIVNYRVDKHRTIHHMDEDGNAISSVHYDGAGNIDEGQSQIETHGEAQIETQSVAPVRQGESHSCDPHKSPSKNPDSPQSPPLHELPTDEGFEEAWLRFVKAYPIDIGDVPLTRNLMRALSPDERDLVIFGAWGYRKFVAEQERRSMDAHRFIRDSKWQGYVESGKHYAPKPPEPERQRNRLWADSADFVAYRIACNIAGVQIGNPPFVEIVGDVPHGAEAMAALIDTGQSWEVVAKHTAQFGAWRERVHEWTGKWVEPKRHWLNEKGEVVPTVKDAFVPKRDDGIPSLPRSIDGLLVPHTDSGFPPPKSARDGPQQQVA